MSRRAAAAALLVAASLAGCVQSDERAVVEPTPSPGVPAQPDTEDSADPHGELACDDDTRVAVDRVVGDQLDAIAAGRWREAWSLASGRYRRSTDLAAFERIVTDAYPTLLDAEGHRSTVCVAEGATVQTLVLVQVGGDEETELVYQLVREEDGWRIDAAARGATDAPVVRV